MSSQTTLKIFKVPQTITSNRVIEKRLSSFTNSWISRVWTINYISCNMCQNKRIIPQLSYIAITLSKAASALLHERVGYGLYLSAEW
jgi:hypothetical protein